jgi:hypothetical protein
MHGADFFYQALVYLTAAVVSVPIARRPVASEFPEPRSHFDRARVWLA